MKRLQPGIQTKLLLLALLPSTLLFVVLFSYFVNERLGEVRDTLDNKGGQIARLLSSAAEFGVITGNRELLTQLLLRVVDQDIAYIEIWDTHGNQLSSYSNSYRNDPDAEMTVFEEPIIRYGLALPPADFSGLSTAPDTEMTIEAISQIGTVYVGVSNRLWYERQEQIITSSFLMASSALLFASLLAWIMGRRISTPLIRLAGVMQALREGRWQNRAQVDQSGEIGQLQSGLNAMADSQLRAQQKLRENLEHLEQARRQAEDASRAKSEFLATMSHELRTPMNGALGCLELLAETTLDDQQRDMLKEANDSTQHLLDVVNEILDFSRIEQGGVQLDPSSLQLDTLLENCVENFHLRAERKGLRLTLQMHNALRQHNFLLDGTKVRQILINLLGNALKFTHSGGIHVSTELDYPHDRHSPVLRIAVTDTGIGIDRHDQERVFEPFRQADGSTTRRYGGSGLGLAIVRRLCRAMGGDIHLQSQPGRGSTFTIILPADQRERTREEEKAPLPPLKRARILLVEDNKVNQMVTGRRLEQLGMTVYCADNGRHALERLEQEALTIDLVFMDLQMPEMDGLEATRHLRQHPQWKQIPIIALTANVTLEDRQHCLDHGMDDYLSKPVTLSTLQTAICRHLPHHKLPTVST